MNKQSNNVTTPEATQDIIEALELSRRLQMLAESGEQHCAGSTCALLYATVRDSAFRIRQLAERAREKHIANGVWEQKKKTQKGSSDSCL